MPDDFVSDFAPSTTTVKIQVDVKDEQRTPKRITTKYQTTGEFKDLGKESKDSQ